MRKSAQGLIYPVVRVRVFQCQSTAASILYRSIVKIMADTRQEDDKKGLAVEDSKEGEDDSKHDATNEQQVSQHTQTAVD